MSTSRREGLRALPDPAPDAEEAPQPERKAYTIEDQYRDNVKLVEGELTVPLTPEAAVNLFAVTLNYQLQKLSMGLSQIEAPQ